MDKMSMTSSDATTIVAPATAPGQGAIAVIRISGPESFIIVSRRWRGADIESMRSHTVHLGDITDTEGEVIDTVILTIFRSPKTYTGEDTVEISCHGSAIIQNEIVRSIIDAGAVPAAPGEFTQRAFLNGRLDLAQAEAVADIIASSSKASLRLANAQARGTLSRELDGMRVQLIELGSLLELELDFSEEDVEFADRSNLLELAVSLKERIERLAASFSEGHMLRDGIPVAIAGIPNAGKSTLLNALVGDDKAIVSPIAGTTRDIVEDTLTLDGILFRIIDTAGIRDTTDPIELMGIDRTRKAMNNAGILLYILDITSDIELGHQLETLLTQTPAKADTLIVLINKTDRREPSPDDIDTLRQILTASISTRSSTDDCQGNATSESSTIAATPYIETAKTWRSRGEATCKKRYAKKPSQPIISISAIKETGLNELIKELVDHAKSRQNQDTGVIVTNARHYAALTSAASELTSTISALETGMTGELIAHHLRQTIHHIGAITGAITTPDLLQSIFSRFCVGK